MTLPDEQAIAQQIAGQFQAQLQAMTELHDAVISMFGAGQWAITKPRGIDVIVVYTVAGLLTKACKTFRAIQMLCAAGLGTDAGSASRSLFETVAPIVFILQTRTKERARIYHAYRKWQNIKMLNHWRQTPGLKRKATKASFANAQKECDYWTNQLPAGVNYKRHWSGLGSLEDALKGMHAETVYAIFYRHTSRFAHGSDFEDHIYFDAAAETVTFNLPPSATHVDTQALVARVILWLAASRINERMGLGFDAVLNARRPPMVQT